VETILAALRQASCHIEDLEMGRADLEDVFLSIMQGQVAAGAPAMAVRA
jgi:ABC-2 type transport system ATP-binding protein